MPPLHDEPGLRSGEAGAAGDPFLDGGFARLAHFRSPAYRAALSDLERTSSAFTAAAWAGGLQGYPWPTDPLHWWSRIWEYPFVAAQLWRHVTRGASVLDVGAAVTFFSAWLVGRGFELTNFDYDAAMPAHFAAAWDRAAPELGLAPAAPPRYLVGDARDSGLRAASYDAVVCVSVLEHIPSWERALDEFVRVLKPGGLLVLTLDVVLKGKGEGLSPRECAGLVDRLRPQAEALTSQSAAIPRDVLHMDNSTCRSAWGPPGPFGIRHALKPWARRLGLRPNLCVFGGAWRRRGG